MLIGSIFGELHNRYATNCILHTSFDAVQHCLNQLKAPTMETVPHGDVPFLGTAEPIRHELKRYQYSTSMSCISHIWRGHLDYYGANASHCNSLQLWAADSTKGRRISFLDDLALAAP